MAQLKLIIFDCDGVMFDSKNANRHFYNRLRTSLGHPPMDEAELEYVHMHHVTDSVSHIFRHWPEDLEKAHQLRQSLDYKDFIKHMTIEPDLIEFLELITPNYRTAISTNRTTTMSTLLDLFDLRRHFGLVVTAMDVENSKPHPDALHKILEHFSMTAEESIFIGDSTVDFEHAAGVGMRLIAFKNPELAADYHVSSFMEIARLPIFGRD
ncbi:MAG: HAD family hydrolase [Desulfurivibrionaceae bacterium]